MIRTSKTLRLATAVAVALSPLPAGAASAGSLSDLIGARASGAEQDMESRGFVMITGHKSRSASYTYWWNYGPRGCVMVTTRDGRIASIVDTTATDCNQRSAGTATKEEVIGTAIGVLLGAALLAHKAGHHDNAQHYSADADEAEYERGFRDGLHDQPYHNYSRSDAYGSGYQNGVDQLQQETAHRNQHRNGAGYAPSENVARLQGEKASGASSDLERRGFRSVDVSTMENEKIAIWWNRKTRQCLQMITVDGRVDSLTDIQVHPHCR